MLTALTAPLALRLGAIGLAAPGKLLQVGCGSGGAVQAPGAAAALHCGTGRLEALDSVELPQTVASVALRLGARGVLYRLFLARWFATGMKR